MRAPILKELMKCFEHELKERWPQFVLFDSERDFKTWSWRIKPNLLLFVSIQAFEREDQFVVEVSWSEGEDFPWGAMGKIEIDRPKGRERLGRLWKSTGDDPVWDISPERTAWLEHDLKAYREGKEIASFDQPPKQVLPRILPLVIDALDKFDKYGMNLFNRVAEARGFQIEI